jgi:hypothetical protein
MLLKLIMGLAVMIFLWAVQTQAAEIAWQKTVTPAQQGNALSSSSN